MKLYIDNEEITLQSNDETEIEEFNYVCSTHNIKTKTNRLNYPVAKADDYTLYHLLITLTCRNGHIDIH